MGGGFANATEKITCLVREKISCFRNAEPVVLQKVELSSMCFPMANLILMHSSVRDKSLNQIREGMEIKP
jgi:hypothetical protein